MALRPAISELKAATSQRGVTLVELLVVMVILALAATIVIINAPPSRSAPREAAGDFAQAFRAAIDEAVISGRVFRMEIEPARWRLMRLDDGEWVEDAGGDGELDDILLRIDVEEAAKSNREAITGARPERRDRDAPVIVPVDPFGATPAFDLSFQRGREVWTFTHRANGDVELARE